MATNTALTLTDIIAAANQAADGKAVARIWAGARETRIYIRRWNGSQSRPWIDAGYLRVCADGRIADYRAEHTLDFRSDAVEAMADAITRAISRDIGRDIGRDAITRAISCDIGRDIGRDAITSAIGRDVNKPAAFDRRAIMTRAWQIARAGAARFGGSVREYFSAALTQAWAEARA